MKITLLKNHFGHIAGTELDVTNERGKYLIRTKTGIEVKEVKQVYVNKPKSKRKK